MADRLKDEVAIVAGAGSSGPGMGIGKATALLFAQEGARVVLVDLHEDRAAETLELVREAGGEAVTVGADISQAEDCDRIVDAAKAAYGTISILVNNAAYTPLLGVAETTPEIFEKVMSVNVTGPFMLSRAAIPTMVERGGGSIVTITSVSALRSGRGKQTAYATSKAALLGLMIDITNEHGLNGIRFNCIAPGMIDTPLRKNTMREAGYDPDAFPYGEASSLGHAGDAWDIARAALFLASSEARFITGVHLPVDGGYTTRTPG